MLKLYNSLTRQVEEFETLGGGKKVAMYTCGPTVYDYVSVGNWRTYFLGDVLLRTLKYLGYEVEYVMNITDVGHLTGDNLGDADLGEDRMEKAAQRENKSAWEIARFYTEDFLRGFDDLNLVRPDVWAKATDHIEEQIKLVQSIEGRGFTYQTDDGVYFDTKAYEAAGYKYGELSTLDEIKAGARVETKVEKRDPRDFALWKFYTGVGRREMEWESPWGKGFPGWHIECSAMSMKYLGEQFDVHVGGEDLRSTHHPNEIAQSEAATGKRPFVKYWVHGAFLLVDGGKMSKSLGNTYTLQTLKQNKVDVLALRYFYLTGHYRKPLNFTWEAMHAAKSAYVNLLETMRRIKPEIQSIESTKSISKEGKVADSRDSGEGESGGLGVQESTEAQKFRESFVEAISDDLNLPEALAVVWGVVKSGLEAREKYELLVDIDRVLGLGLAGVMAKEEVYRNLPAKVRELIEAREGYRQVGDYKSADSVRKQIEKLGYEVKDTEDGSEVRERD